MVCFLKDLFSSPTWENMTEDAVLKQTMRLLITIVESIP